MKKLILSLLGVSSLLAVILAIANTKRHLAVVGGAALLVAQTNAQAQLLINGAGATFPYPIYSKWFDEYAKVDPSVRFNYQSIGSGGGQKQITARTVDFGASDGPMSDENLAKAPGKILHIPTVAGAVVITTTCRTIPSSNSTVPRWLIFFSAMSPNGTIPKSPRSIPT
jgi:ABC-type phosphate transport system substrate-binding protein